MDFRSTWARYYQDITQAKVIEFAKEINSYGLPNSQIEIDDKWETCYGDLKFDTKKFPDAKKMTQELNALGFRTTLWVHPFVNLDCEEYKKGHDYFIKNRFNKSQVAIQTWWNGNGAHIDWTDHYAREWFVDRIQQLKNSSGLDSFKFDAGEFGWVNRSYQLSDEIIHKTPSVFTQLYAETVSRLGNNRL